MMHKTLVVAALVCALEGMALAEVGKTLLDLPVSATENALYLKGMSERPWWNKAWTRRAPLLVSSRAKVKCGKVVVDAVVDFGEEVKPEDVRVVTPWEELVDCVAERVESKSRVEVEERKDSTLRLGLGTSTSSTAIRLLFVTDLRIEENRPFLVYYARQGEDALATKSADQRGKDVPVSECGKGAPASECRKGVPALADRKSPNNCSPSPSSSSSSSPSPSIFTSLQMRVTDAEVRIANGILDVTFDNLHRTPGLIKRIRVLASQTPNELLDRATGFAWSGFAFTAGGPETWSKAQIVADNALVKTIRFASERAELDFSLYADQPRVDYAYRLKPGLRNARVDVSWAVGDGTGEDDLFYPGLADKVLSFRASLDTATDSIADPSYWDFHYWMKDGWYAIRDRREGEVVGMLFDRRTLSFAAYNGAGQSAGEKMQLAFNYAGPGDVPFAGTGALVAMVGGVEEVRNEYLRYCEPPVVRLGKPEGVRDIPYRRPRFDRDFCADFNIGKGSGAGWESGDPLEGGEWCSNIVDHIRSLGANAVRVGGYNWQDLPVTKDLYDRMVAARIDCNPKLKDRPFPAWKDGAFTGEKFRQYCDAAHAKGVAVSLWTGYSCGVAWHDDYFFNRALQDVDIELQNLYADLGADAIYNARACRESAHIPARVLKGRNKQWYTWDDPRDFFELEKENCAEIRRFYRESKKRHPDVPVVIMNSECSIIERETMMTEQAGAVDTVYCEMLPECDTPRTLVHVKQAVKRLRALYDNAPHTVHNHFYYYGHTYNHRVMQVDLPFVFGINGFTFENLTYENFGTEQPNITADGYRFLGYTKLGDTVAKMAPVKDVAVFRDNRAYVDDVINHRRKKPYGYMTQQDGRANAVLEVKNLACDIVIDPFFTAKALAKYRAVFVPEDLSFGEDRAKELLEYVKQGGGAVVEGKIGMESKSKGEVEDRRTDTLRRTDTPVRSEQESNNSTLRLRLGTSTLTLTDGTVTPYGKGKIVWIKDVLTDKLVWRGKKEADQLRALLKSVGSIPPYTLDAKVLDSNLQASDEGLFLGVYNEGNERDSGVVTLGERTLLSVRGNVARASSTVCRKGVPALAEGKVTSISQGEDALATKNQGEDALATMKLYVLDMKNGTRVPLTNNTFTVSCGPKQCSYYLIGDDAFTAIPETKVAAWKGASIAANGRMARLNTAKATVDPAFRIVKAVEFVTGTAAKPTTIRRSVDGAYDVVRFTKDRARAADVQEAIADATYVHFATTAKDFDNVFAENAESLKALLKRGGGILFDRSATGPKARSFLAEVGVYDPNLAATNDFKVGAAVLAENVSTNSLLYPEKAEWFNQGNTAGRAYAKWDTAKQQAVYVLKERPEWATAIVQDNVLGKGKVVFTENLRAYNDWYENMRYGESFLSWLTGIPFKRHAENVKLLNGGPGKVF